MPTLVTSDVLIERAHGTRTKYVQDGCRCFRCRLANAAYEQERARARIELRPWRVRYCRPAGEWYVEHQLTREQDFRTRDQREAYEIRDALNARGAADSDQEPTWAPRATVRQVLRHLEALARTGIGLRQVARQSGVGRTRLSEIRGDFRGEPGGGKRRGRGPVKLETAEAILALPIAAAGAAPAALIDARETWRLIEELRGAGLPKYRIAAALGSRGNPPALRLSRSRVQKRTEDRVRELHDTAFRASARLRAVCCCPEWR